MIPAPCFAQQQEKDSERQATERRIAHERARDHVRRLKAVLSSLGERLMLPPDFSESDGLTRLYHSVSDRLHVAEMAEKQLG